MTNNWNEVVVNRLERDWNKTKKQGVYETFSIAGSRGSSFLDIGCGTGRFYNFIYKFCDEYVGYDSSEAMIQKARSKYPDGNFILYDITTPFKHDAEVILCNEVFIHLLPELQIKVLDNINKCSANTIIITIQTSISPKIEKVGLEKEVFFNVVQDSNEFGSILFSKISNIESINIERYHLTKDVYKSVFLIERG